MTPEMREAYAVVDHRDQHTCQRCGRRGGPQSHHHRKPRGMGGRNRGDAARPSNIVTLCGTGTTGCHGWVESHRGQAYADGWLVHDWHDPATTPAHTRWGARLYTDRGTTTAPEPPVTTSKD